MISMSFFLMKLFPKDTTDHRLEIDNFDCMLDWPVMCPEFSWADWYTEGSHVGVTMLGTKQINFQNLSLQIFWKCTPWLQSVLRFFCKTFSKLLNLTLRKTLFCRWFLKNSYIQIKKLYHYKLISYKAIWT